MKKLSILFFLLLIILNFNLNSLAQNTQNEIIAKINGEDIFQNDFNRHFNAQKKKFYTDLNFDLFSLPTANPKATLKREELLRKAKEEGIVVNANEFNNAWTDLITKSGTLENLEKRASKNLLTTTDLRKKTKENIVLEKLFEKQTKEKLIEKIINEMLVLQEAKVRNITVPEEEIINRLNVIKEKQGGEEAFNKFLSENNATLEDARNEIKNQILIQLVKNQISDLNTFLAMKKLKSDIIIYTSKIFSKEPGAFLEAEVDPSNTIRAGLVRVGLKPTPTTAPIKMEEETANILAEEIQKEVEVGSSTEKPTENKIFISDIKEDTIIEPINVSGKISKLQNKMNNSSKILQELRRKIEQRRVVNR